MIGTVGMEIKGSEHLLIGEGIGRYVLCLAK